MKMGACLAAVDAVMARPDAPSMVSIPACGWNHEMFYVSVSKDRHTALVRGQVHAQDSSGAMLRGHWEVKLKNGQRGWTPVRVTVDE